MKTPKVATPKPKLKFSTPKIGLVRKSLGNNSTASLKKLTTKGKEQVLSMVKDNEENIEFKSKTPNKARMSLPANALRNTKASPENGAKTPKKSPRNKKGASVPEPPNSGKKNNVNNKTPAKDSPASKPQNVKKTPQVKNVQKDASTPASVENNTSPIKQNVESKKNKVPFNLNDSLANGTPKQKKGTTPGKGKPKSPEVELGLQLEVALSPKSKKEKKKKMALSVKVANEGKVAVNKKVVKKLDVTTNDSSPDSKQKKKRRKRNRSKGKKTTVEKKERQPSFLKHVNALNAVSALLKTSKPEKSKLLDVEDYIFLQFSLLKHSKDSRGVYKVVLPHSILPDTPEVCLIVPDLKGKRNEPEEAIDHYKELLKKNDVTSITEIIPLRRLKQDYSQFEERRKLTNRFDCIISDGRITHAAQLGKRFARAKKCICAVKFDSTTLNEDISKALRKVAIFSSGRGTSFSVKCGRRGMTAGEIADNIVAIGEFLANNENMIGEPLNVAMVGVKTALSPSFPVYASTATPNDVKKPKGKKVKVEEPVEDEITTVTDGTVVVYPSGNVKVKKRKNEEDKDDEDVKQKGNKKAKANAPKKLKIEIDADDDEEEDDSDGEMDSSDDDDSAVDSLNGTDDEASDDDESEVDDDDDDEDEDDDDEDDDEDDDQSIDEEEIEAAEKAYLEELMSLQKEMGKKKGKKSGKTEKIVVKKEEPVKQQNKNVAAKGGKKQEKKAPPQKQAKKVVLKEQDINAKGKKVEKQTQAKQNQNNLPKKKQQTASPQNQQKGNQNQKKNKFGSPQNQQKGKVEQFGKGKGPNKRNAQKGGSPGQGKKQFKKGPGGKNKN